MSGQDQIKQRSHQETSFDLFWHELKKNRLAMGGLYCVVALVFLATYACWIALDVPFRMIEKGQVVYPFFVEIFNLLRFPSMVDIAFNLFSFFLLPVSILSFVLPLSRQGLGRLWIGTLGLWFVVLVGLYLPVTQKGSLLDSWQHTKGDFKEAYGKEGSLFPLSPVAWDSNPIRDTLVKPMSKDSYGRTYLLGTDNRTRDVFGFLLYGTRISLTVGVVAVGIYIFIGIVLGSLAGFYGGSIDNFISRLIEVVITFPALILIISIMAFISDPNIFMVMGVIGLTGWPGVARLVRAEFMRLRGQDFVVAATSIGLKQGRIIFRHILPNALGPVLVSAALGVPAAIITEGGLSFLGLGDPHSPSWGQLLNAGRQSNLTPWLVHPPGIAIFLTVTAMNLLGDGIRDALDPKLRGR